VTAGHEATCGALWRPLCPTHSDMSRPPTERTLLPRLPPCPPPPPTSRRSDIYSGHTVVGGGGYRDGLDCRRGTADFPERTRIRHRQIDRSLLAAMRRGPRVAVSGFSLTDSICMQERPQDFGYGGQCAPCRLRRRKFKKLTTKWCILKYI